MPPTKTIEWSKFAVWFSRIWQQGEHTSIIGPTGRGKSTLAYALLPMREWSIVFGTKPNDDTLTKFAKKYSFRTQTKFAPSLEKTRYLVWPKYKKPGDEAEQRKVFDSAFGEIFAQGGWTLYVDETWYFEHTLKLSHYLNAYWSQSRSNNITFMAATQRPRNVPLMMYDQCTHLFLFKVVDAYARKRLGEIGGIDSKTVASEVANLTGHQFLYINTVDDTVPRMISEVK